MDLDEVVAESNARARHRRRIARWTLLLAIVLVAMTTLLVVAAPNMMGGGRAPQADWLLGVAVVGSIIGLVWMVRILRADPEPDAKNWRYKDS